MRLLITTRKSVFKEVCPMKKYISIKGARENNLKNISVDIPRDALTVITGVSGSGKSSLAFDVVYGEGQRRFLESISAYARRYIPQVKKPAVDFISGLSPVVSIEQKTSGLNPRSTVGTMTDIYDYLRLLYCSIGIAHCPYCGSEVPVKTANQIAERILSLPKGTVVYLKAPVHKIYGEDYNFLFDELRKKGCRLVKIDGVVKDTSEKLELDEFKEYELEAIIDKFTVKPDIYKALLASIENGLKLIGESFISLELENVSKDRTEKFFKDFACPEHHTLMGETLPFYFSYNDPDSACRTCIGLGTYKTAEPSLILSNTQKSIKKGALDARIYKLDNPSAWRNMILYSLSQHYNFSLDVPFYTYPKDIVDILFYGTKGEKFEFLGTEEHGEHHWSNQHRGKFFTYDGIVNEIDRWYRNSRRKQELKSYEETMFKKFMVEHECPECGGMQLKKQRLLITVGGKNIQELGRMSLDNLYEFLDKLKFPANKKDVGEHILREIKSRLELLIEIGLEYLNLNRKADTLSGGEAQRIRLSTQIGSELMGMLYVLDEPSIGLHARDVKKVINTLKKLRDIGNTVIVVEHDTETIAAADYVVELGQGAGLYGGNIVAMGDIKNLLESESSLTGQFLSGKRSIEIPKRRRVPQEEYLTVVGARENSLRNVTVEIPLGVFLCVTGVSGSGKSSLINDILYKKLHSVFHDPRVIPGKHDAVEGIVYLSNVINIDQSPIGRMPTSNPATYVGFFDKIRDLYASIPEAVERGYTNSQFSFNAKGGRCEECKGFGIVTTELQFMPDIETICPVCRGKRFTQETLEIKYKGKDIHQVLEMSIDEAVDFFEDQKYICHKLKVLKDLGLGYIKLGQSATTLSGGEAQRIKLATELGKIKRGAHNLYILDEPTTGLHLADIQKLLICLNRLVDAGHTVLVIEHHLDVIKTADYIIDMGPGGGRNGGYVIAAGTPEVVMDVKESYTGQYLKEYLTQSYSNTASAL
jgi:excinuclease ABC subunit A